MQSIPIYLHEQLLEGAVGLLSDVGAELKALAMPGSAAAGATVERWLDALVEEKDTSHCFADGEQCERDADVSELAREKSRKIAEFRTVMHSSSWLQVWQPAQKRCTTNAKTMNHA
eukprot:SAG11_NODE_80_length_17731_cov_13.985254_16_plen_116_part_00